MADLVDLGPFRPERLIANGTRTQVWAAVGPDGTAVAVKVARGEENRPAVAREIAIYERLDTPGVPRFIEAAPSGRWMAIERIDGIPIDEWAQKAREKTLSEVSVQILEILHHLHGLGVIHADIKPSNVLIDQHGSPVLVDFGAAILRDQPVKGFRGTLGFAAPELLEGETPTPQTDVYGFGALLYACLTGRPPFVLPDPAALAYVPTITLPAPPSTWVPGIPARIDHLVMTLLARNPARRPADPRAVSQALLTAPRDRMAKRVLGMHDERDALRRLVVQAAAGGTCGAVVYGPAGSGRLTLISETLEAAVREGMTYLRGTTPTGAETTLTEQEGPAVLVFRATQRDAQTATQSILSSHAPCLVLIHSDRPLPRLEAVGAVQITPPPLTRSEAGQLVSHLGGDMALADEWRDAAQGLPIGIVGRCRRWMAQHTPQPSEPAELAPRSRRLLSIIEETGEIPLFDLAERARLKEMSLLEHCEVLLAQGLVVPTQNGAALAVAPPSLPEEP